MIERIEFEGVAASFVATAYIVLPGDQRIEVPLKLRADTLGPTLVPDFSAAHDELNRRGEQNP